MVADIEGVRRLGYWAAYRRQPGWVGVVANGALVLSAGGLGAALLYLAKVISAANVAAAAVMIVVFAAFFGAAAAAVQRMHAALAGRVDILSQALDASPDPQLILAPDGRIAYANTAFHNLFPQAGEPPLARLSAVARAPIPKFASYCGDL